MCRLRPARLDHFLEIRNRLEVVGVKLPGVKREFGLDVVVEFHHLELHAFLFKRGLDEVDDVGVRHGVTPMRSVVSASALEETPESARAAASAMGAKRRERFMVVLRMLVAF